MGSSSWWCRRPGSSSLLGHSEARESHSPVSSRLCPGWRLESNWGARRPALISDLIQLQLSPTVSPPSNSLVYRLHTTTHHWHSVHILALPWLLLFTWGIIQCKPSVNWWPVEGLSRQLISRRGGGRGRSSTAYQPIRSQLCNQPGNQHLQYQPRIKD